MKTIFFFSQDQQVNVVNVKIYRHTPLVNTVKGEMQVLFTKKHRLHISLLILIYVLYLLVMKPKVCHYFVNWCNFSNFQKYFY